MALSLKIVVPEKVVFEGAVSSVVLPTALGEIEILEGHLPIVGILEPGAAIYKIQGKSYSIAIDAGFYRLQGEQLVLMTEAAIDIQGVDMDSIDKAVRSAEEALEKARQEKVLDAEEIERLDKILRFQVAQKLMKQNKN